MVVLLELSQKRMVPRLAGSATTPFVATALAEGCAAPGTGLMKSWQVSPAPKVYSNTTRQSVSSVRLVDVQLTVPPRLWMPRLKWLASVACCACSVNGSLAVGFAA